MSTTALFPAPATCDLTMVVAQNVRKLMVTRSVTQMTLASAMRLNQTSISKRLRGITPWDVTDLEKLCGIFGVSAAELVTAELPRLDSNQQPADSPSGLVARVARVVQLRPARTAAAG